MAFRNLIEADCGGQNPLMKLGGHFSQDPALRQDRPLPIQLSDAESFVNEFLEDQFAPKVQSFRMDALVEEMRNIELFSSRAPINQAPNVALLASREPDAFWAEEFSQGKQETPIGAEMAARFHANEPIAKENTAEIWSTEFEAAALPSLSWAENFITQRQDELNVMSLADVDTAALDSESKFQRFWQRAEESEKWAEELASTSKPADNAEGIEGYGESVDDMMSMFKRAWEELSGSAGSDANSWSNEFNTFVDPFTTYEFDNENPMKELEDPFEEGLKKLENQDLPSAVLCFEAAVQSDPDNAKYWQYLGTTQAENEQDPFAIAALKKCLGIQPDNLNALLSLAISYTNENYQNQACQMLREWIQHNPLYKDLCSPQPPADRVTSLMDIGYHAEVKDMFIKAANRTPKGQIDVDVQCALGVLFNLSSEYDKAVDCFKCALQVTPEDFRLWNRLGATLANGSRSEEAVDAYYHALQLSPGYIRARYNLGITCINLKAYRESVEHLLTALNLQAKGTTSRGEKGNMSESIWGTLRLVISLLGNHELLPHVEMRNLEHLNKEFSIK